MYQVILALQIISILIVIFSIASLLHFRLGMDARYLMLTAVCVLIYAVGYCGELLAENLQMAHLAMAFEFLGISYAGSLFALFICEYCNYKPSRNFWRFMMFFNTFIMAVSTTSFQKDLFFKKSQWIEDGTIPHVKYDFGPFYYIFIVVQLFLMVYCIAIISKYKKSVTKQSEKTRLVALTGICFVPMFGCISGVAMLDVGYDPVSFYLSLTIAFLTYILTHWKMVNVANQAYSSLFKDLDEGVIIADADHHFLDANVSAEFIFTELKTMEPGANLDEIEVPLCSFGKTDVFERNGRFYQSLAKPIIERRKQVGFLIVITDVSQMYVQIEEMQDLKEEADNANKAKSVFLANMSHEIRTPLNAIIGMAELSERETDTKVIKDYISQIKSSGKMLLDIICETLDLSKAESGKLDIIPEEFDMAGLLNGVINVINMRIGDKPVKFYVDVDPEMPARLFSDDVRIRQIMINFLGNAEKYTQTGSIIFKVDFDILEARKIMLKVSVSDTGSGIRQEDMDKLFMPFSQVDMKKNRRIVGTGLGLAISAKLLEEMEGTYAVESVYGVGSTFSFEVPINVLDPVPIAPCAERTVFETEKYRNFNLYNIAKEKTDEEIKKEKEEEPKFPEAKVLVVDDNKVNVKVLAAYLKQFEIKAEQCFSGVECLKMVEENEYDLIFMDHMMPEMDGAETASHIRKSEKEWNKRVPIVACSANVMKGADELFIESGMNDYISKPVQFDILRKKVIKYLDV